MYVDSHCHLNMLSLYEQGDLDRVIAAASAAGVTSCLCVATTLDNSNIVQEIASRYDRVYASVGVHPSETMDKPLTVTDIVSQVSSDKVVAVGETGLDYYYDCDDTDAMRQRFRTHIHAAQQLKKPLIIHTRSAQKDTIDIMQQENAAAVGGVMHCFTEDWAMAQAALDMGFYISLSGIVTFKNASQVQDVAKQVPLDRLLIETDSPYLAPVPFRGKENEPAYVVYVAQKIAELRNMSVEDIARASTDNFKSLFLPSVDEATAQIG